MNKYFCSLFANEPINKENGIYFFDSDFDADYFELSDVEFWRSECFAHSFHRDDLLTNPASRRLLEHIVAHKTPIVDVACGPGMGLIPAVKQLEPKHLCLATDASSLVISEWKKYMEKHENPENLDFAQFSLMNIPFKNESVPAYSSYIGLSSTRNGDAGKEQALREIHRTLAPNGYFYTIESTWSDIDAILEVFDKIDQTPWHEVQSLSPQRTWRHRFLDVGFEIISEEIFEYRKFTSKDNELGEAAEKLGIDIGTVTTAYILRKTEL